MVDDWPQDLTTKPSLALFSTKRRAGSVANTRSRVGWEDERKSEWGGYVLIVEVVRIFSSLCDPVLELLVKPGNTNVDPDIVRPRRQR